MREIMGSRLDFVKEWLNFDGLRGSANMTDQRGTGTGIYIDANGACRGPGTPTSGM
ncbi:TPA: hypothetical protein NPN33_004188 [Klebsiella variicola subsp. variicola]|nr:hypothetical protein [Klebsiella variicola subsp. variicola]HDK6350026.1 hypothetical protein [Klebsiella pneumoniae]